MTRREESFLSIPGLNWRMLEKIEGVATYLPASYSLGSPILALARPRPQYALDEIWLLSRPRASRARRNALAT
jgi:hypothetical protein